MGEVNFNFTGKRFIVTGASSGMGRQIAVELAQTGAVVLGIARRKSLLETLAEMHPQKIRIAALDVCDKAAMEAAIENFVAAEGKLNGLVHAAGFSALTPLRGFDENLARQMLEVHFWAGIHLLRIAAQTRYMQQGSSTVLFSSVAGFLSEKGMLAYCAAKAALHAAMKSAAKEIVKKSHRVNTISPGWVKNDLTEKMTAFYDKGHFEKRHLLDMGSNQDVSGVVLFLLSDRARWITGTDIVVDGGYLA